jgi:hypothetical protein
VNSKCSFAACCSIVDAQDLNNILNGIAVERACYIPQSKCTEHRAKYIQDAMSSMFLISFINEKGRSKFQIVTRTRKSIIGLQRAILPPLPIYKTCADVQWIGIKLPNKLR